MAAVAALFQKTFRDPSKPAPAALEAYLAEAYLEHPWYDPEIAPRVHVNAEDRVTGFVGVFPGRFEHRGQSFRAAIAGSLMVEHPEREPLAGAKLLRAAIRGPQDISISETTNAISQGLWERLGGNVVPLLSLDWFRVFQPASAGLSMLAETHPRAAIAAPAARLADRVAAGWTKRYLKLAEPSARLEVDSAPSDRDFAAAIIELARAVELRPAWSGTDLDWLLAHAAQKDRYGPVHRAIVRGGRGDLIGCYIYHGKAGGIGRVLQALPGRKTPRTSSIASLTKPAAGASRACAVAARRNWLMRC